MAEWLSRPMLTDIDEHTPAPNPAVDDHGKGQLSPIVNLKEQFKLVQVLSLRFGRLADLKDVDHVRGVVYAVDQWIDELPEELSMQGCDRSQDEQYPWLPCQRTSLHCFARMAQLTPLKQMLTTSPTSKPELGGENLDLRHLTARLCIECIESGLSLCHLLRPFRGSFHFVVFVLFDTATFICSALLSDSNKTLPQRSCLLRKANDALAALEALAAQTRSARHASEVLRWLLERLDHLHKGDGFVDVRPTMAPAEERSTPTSAPDGSFQQKGSSAASAKHSLHIPAAASYANVVDNSGESIPSSSTLEQSWSNSPQCWNFQNPTDSDMGGLECIWDWETLGLTPALQLLEDEAISGSEVFH